MMFETPPRKEERLAFDGNGNIQVSNPFLENPIFEEMELEHLNGNTNLESPSKFIMK